MIFFKIRYRLVNLIWSKMELSDFHINFFLIFVELFFFFLKFSNYFYFYFFLFFFPLSKYLINENKIWCVELWLVMHLCFSHSSHFFFSHSFQLTLSIYILLLVSFIPIIMSLNFCLHTKYLLRYYNNVINI